MQCVGHTYTTKLFVVYLKFQLNRVSVFCLAIIHRGCPKPRVWETRAWECASDHFPRPLASAPGRALLTLLLGLFTLAPEDAPSPPPLGFLSLRRPLRPGHRLGFSRPQPGDVVPTLDSPPGSRCSRTKGQGPRPNALPLDFCHSQGRNPIARGLQDDGWGSREEVE